LAGRYCTATLSFARFQLLFSAASVQKQLRLFDAVSATENCKMLRLGNHFTSGLIICIEKFQSRLNLEKKLYKLHAGTWPKLLYEFGLENPEAIYSN
jgi:hypothetical protein